MHCFHKKLIKFHINWTELIQVPLATVKISLNNNLNFRLFLWTPTYQYLQHNIICWPEMLVFSQSCGNSEAWVQQKMGDMSKTRKRERICRQRIACSVSAEKGKCVCVCVRERERASAKAREYRKDRDRNRKDNE